MQRYSNPNVFFCPLYNAPGVANPKMHICDPEEELDDVMRPFSECSTPELSFPTSSSPSVCVPFGLINVVGSKR